MRYFKNLKITTDKEYSRSYGRAETWEAPLAKLDDKGWLHIYHYSDIGTYVDVQRKSTAGKHFHGFKGTEIAESTFNKHERNAHNRAKKNREEMEKREKMTIRDSHKKYQERLKITAEIMEPLIPQMQADGIHLISTCKGSRGASYHIFNKYELHNKGISIQDVRNWMRTTDAQNKYYEKTETILASYG